MTNLLGLSYSKQTSVEIVDRVNEDHCREILDMKMKVEEAYSRGMTSRQMKATGCGGFSLFSDNVGKGIQPRFDTGLTRKLPSDGINHWCIEQNSIGALK